MSERDLVEQLSFLEKKVLKALHGEKSASPEDILKKSGLTQLVEVMNAASWLQSKGLVTISESIAKSYSLKKKDAASKPLPERTAIEILAQDFGGRGSLSQLKKTGKLKNEQIQIALGWIRKKGWGEVSKDEKDTVVSLTDKGRQALTTKGDDELLMERLSREDVTDSQADKAVIDSLKQRKDFLVEKHITARMLSLTDAGARIASQKLEMKEEVGQLTPELIQSGRWREVDMRKYDVRAFAPTVYGGRQHPMTLLIENTRNAFLTMGFREIAGNFVESAFWNMDALFTAQDHPARELHDTFYVKDPARMDLSEDKELVEIVRQVHENGWKTGSTGWRYKWSLSEAEKTLLRTHTTVDTIRYIAKNPEPPFKVFSIGRIFRSEAMDSTHLPEFTQIEGIVCEEGANFDMLCGLLKEFYIRMGIPRIRIRPAYFPYTEPSLEVEMFWDGQWMELGGAGIFRPEVTEPLGVHEPVLAWGLGLERLAMLVYGLADIRDIYVSDIDWLKKAPQI
jgi:phenylalanyl-tRNA synthetase alpha chain